MTCSFVPCSFQQVPEVRPHACVYRRSSRAVGLLLGICGHPGIGAPPGVRGAPGMSDVPGHLSSSWRRRSSGARAPPAIGSAPGIRGPPRIGSPLALVLLPVSVVLQHWCSSRASALLLASAVLPGIYGPPVSAVLPVSRVLPHWCSPRALAVL